MKFRLPQSCCGKETVPGNGWGFLRRCLKLLRNSLEPEEMSLRIELEPHHPALFGWRIVPLNDARRHQIVVQHDGRVTLPTLPPISNRCDPPAKIPGVAQTRATPDLGLWRSW